MPSRAFSLSFVALTWEAVSRLSLLIPHLASSLLSHAYTSIRY